MKLLEKVLEWEIKKAENCAKALPGLRKRLKREKKINAK